MTDDSEYFGSPDKIALTKRSWRLWLLLRDNPRYAYYGRLVALSDPGDDAVDILEACAALQGATACYFLPKASAADLLRELRARGLKPDRHEHYRGGEDAFRASRAVLSAGTLPADLTISIIDRDTPAALVAEVAELCQSCDVMPVPGPVMRGLVVPGLCLVATDRSGRAVATASSYMLHHPSSPRAADAFWGMLATREDRRGERIGLLLGAHAIVHMWERHGARGFMTGVRADNASSRALCNRLGVRDTEWIYASCIDPELMASASVTK